MAQPHTQQAYFHMMAKPTSYRCNLDCEYCFYLEKETVLPPQKNPSPTMSDSMLRRYVRDYLRSHAGIRLILPGKVANQRWPAGFLS